MFPNFRSICLRLEDKDETFRAFEACVNNMCSDNSASSCTCQHSRKSGSLPSLNSSSPVGVRDSYSGLDESEGLQCSACETESKPSSPSRTCDDDVQSECSECTSTGTGPVEASSHGGGVCLIGLHSCGDLVPVMLKLFDRVAGVRCLLCCGCCYHRMSAVESGISNTRPCTR